MKIKPDSLRSAINLNPVFQGICSLVFFFFLIPLKILSEPVFLLSNTLLQYANNHNDLCWRRKGGGEDGGEREEGVD